MEHECPECGSMLSEFLYNDYDYNEYDDIYTWDVYKCCYCNEVYTVETSCP